MTHLRFALVALMLGASACAQTPERVTPAMTPLTQGEGGWCSADRAWCVNGSGDAFTATHRGQHAGSLDGPGNGDPFTEGENSVWPFVVQLADANAAYVGLVRTRRTTYSGGGASAAFVSLYEVRAGASTSPVVLEAPLSGEAMIRACFTPQDETRRAGACHDEYEYTGTLALDAAGQGEFPTLTYSAHARSYPGVRNRSDDSSAGPRLTQADVRWASDATCTFTRTLTRTGAAYAWNPARPACDTFLDIP